MPSNLAETVWKRDGMVLTPTGHFQFLRDGLLILNASDSDTGRYHCLSVERSKAGTYTTHVAEYQVNIGLGGSGDGKAILPQAQTNGPSVVGLQVVIGLLSVSLLSLLTWNFYKGYIPLPCYNKNREQKENQGGLNSTVAYQETKRSAQAEDKLLESGRDNGNSKNHSSSEVASGVTEEDDASKAFVSSLQYIDDESEI